MLMLSVKQLHWTHSLLKLSRWENWEFSSSNRYTWFAAITISGCQWENGCASWATRRLNYICGLSCMLSVLCTQAGCGALISDLQRRRISSLPNLISKQLHLKKSLAVFPIVSQWTLSLCELLTVERRDSVGVISKSWCLLFCRNIQWISVNKQQACSMAHSHAKVNVNFKLVVMIKPRLG